MPTCGQYVSTCDHKLQFIGSLKLHGLLTAYFKWEMTPLGEKYNTIAAFWGKK